MLQVSKVDKRIMKELNYLTINNSVNNEADKKINETLTDLSHEKGIKKLVIENM